MPVEIRLLGAVAAARDGVSVRLGGPKQRAALALLACRAGLAVTSDELIEALWGEDPPPTAATALQGHVSQLRRLLGADAIETRKSGYVLALGPDDVDAQRFERLARGGAPRAALALWQGRALADVAALADALHHEAERLEELRRETCEELFDAEIAAGRHAEVVTELEAFVRAEPTRERTIGQLMLALYRSGRQADALAVYRRFRQELNAHLALEPGRVLRDLERQILIQDPALAPPAAPRSAPEQRLPLSVVAIGLELPDGDGLDAEAYARAAERARETVRLVLERHGASVERAGGAVIGLFGTPTPSEDDAARALAAARAALVAIEALEAAPPVQARAGVASGESFRGESAAVERALRLQAQAAAGGLEADEPTQARARGRMLRLDRTLAGRAAERHRLRELHDAVVRDRRSAVAVLAGPPGIGKSRLAEDLAAAVEPQTRVLRARCLSYGDGVALLPAAELVREAAALPTAATTEAARTRLSLLLAGDDRAAAVTEQLLALLGLAGTDDDDGAGWAVRRLLDALAEHRPTLVLLDDLQWAAPAFLQVVERLAQPNEAPLLVVATTRDALPEWLKPSHIALAPLRPEACAELVGGLLGSPVETHSLARLTERSGGNPLFLEELVHDLRASGRLCLEDGAWRLERGEETLPQSIRSVLAARVGRLPEPERDLLAACSVLGRSFTLAALADLADDVDEPLAALVAAGLVQPSSTAGDDLEFRHGLIRDAAYASLALSRRADLHERVVAHLDRGSDAGLRERGALAFHHLDQAHRARSSIAPDDPKLTAAAAELAARAASLGHDLLARGNAAEASTVLARVLELEPGHSLAAIELGRARFDAGDLAGADRAFERAEAGPLAERARVGRCEVLLHTDPECDLEGTGDEIDRLLVALRGQRDEDGVVEALLARAYVSATRGRIAELGATLEEALVVAQAAGRSRAEAEILFLVCGASWYGPLPVDEAIRRCERVLAEARERPVVEAAALQALGVLHAMNGDATRARERVALSRSIRREIGQDLGAAASAIDAGLVELLAGDPEAAEAVFRGGFEELERLGEKGYFSTLAALLARAVVAQGRADEARALAQASAAATAPGDVASHVTRRAAEARALGLSGAAEEARSLAREAVEIADATDFSLLRADARAAAGDVDGAAAILRQKGLDASAISCWLR